MKTFRLLSVALFAVLAVGVVAVASASAAVTFLAAEWLIGGGVVNAKVPSDASGELLLEDTKGGLFGEAVAVLCNGSLDGNVGPKGEDEITEALNAKEETIGAPLVGLALECVSETGPCESPLVWADNLPWKTLAELMVDGTEEFFVDLLLSNPAGNPGWEIECMNAFGAVSDLCTAAPENITHLTNLAEDVGAEFTEAFTVLAEIKLGTCERGGAETGVVESDAQGLILVATGALSVFS